MQKKSLLLICLTMIVVAIPTFNEQLHIARAVKNAFSLSRKVFVFDSGSTDQTIDLARGAGAEVVIVNDSFTFADKLNFIYNFDQFQGMYIFRLDADEVVSLNSAQTIKQAILKPVASCYTLSRAQCFLRRRLYWGRTILPSLRLAKAGSIAYENVPLDERIIPLSSDFKIIHLKATVLDSSLIDIAHWFDKHNKYSTLESRFVLAESNNQYLLRKSFTSKVYYCMPILLRPFLVFFFRYILCFGFLDGLHGLMYHTCHSLIYRLMVDIKILSTNQGK